MVCGFSLTGLGYGTIAGICEHDIKPSHSIKAGNLLRKVGINISRKLNHVVRGENFHKKKLF
jgi:hypothetical protein